MLTYPAQLAPAPSPTFAPLLAARPGAHPAVIELARLACPLVLRLAYDWAQASVESGLALVQGAASGPADEFALVTVPLLPRLGRFSGQSFLLEVVRDGETGQWRLAYAPGGRLRELSASQRRGAAELLAEVVPAGAGEVVAYWH